MKNLATLHKNKGKKWSDGRRRKASKKKMQFLFSIDDVDHETCHCDSHAT
jgi:hypothetical protein